MNLPYNYLIHQITDESGIYFYGRIIELDGCQSTGETFEEALENLHEAKKGWLEVKLEYQDSIPNPIGDESYSGKFVVRMPKSLHRRLALEAELEGISLNQYVNYKLSI